MNDDDVLMALGDDPTIRQAIKFFEVIGMPARNFARRTREEYGKDLRLLALFLEQRGIVRLDQLTLDVLESYQAEMDARAYASASRQRKTYAIRAILTFLFRKGLVHEDIGTRLIPPRRTQKEPRYLPREEYQALMRACQHHPRDAAIIELVLQTGLRRAEVASLTVDDILELPKRPTPEPENVGIIQVRRKGGKVQTIPLNYKACRALQAYLEVRPPCDEQALFLSKYRAPLSSRAILNAVKKHAREAGISRVGVHTLRHTHGTHHALQGTDLRTIQANLGHASVTTTSMYVHLAKKAQRKAVQEHAL